MDQAKGVITVADLVAAGACYEGVVKAIQQLPTLPIAMPVAQALKAATDDERHYVERAAGLCGDGYGAGYGTSCGDGNGYGTGYGDGYGYGDGTGYGNGTGDGYGYGYGDGDGDGYGYGYGYGDGDGYGYGDGDNDGNGYGDGDGDGYGCSNGDGYGDGPPHSGGPDMTPYLHGNNRPCPACDGRGRIERPMDLWTPTGAASGAVEIAVGYAMVRCGECSGSGRVALTVEDAAERQRREI